MYSNVANDNNTMYKAEFKYWKSRRPPADMSLALDFRDPATASRSEVSPVPLHLDWSGQETELGLRSMQEWRAWTLADRPGLVVIPDVLSPEGQRYWARRCVADFTLPPAKLNVNRHGLLYPGETWWEACRVRLPLVHRLRWATLGYHHDWDTKQYSEEARSAFPSDLARLSRIVVGAATNIAMTAQAAIVNFYSRDSTLSGHTDHSEANHSAPLLSISIGQSAIFLIGTTDTEKQLPPKALLLRSGDAVVMSGPSRLCLHGVPRVVMASEPTWRDGIGTKEGTLIGVDCDLMADDQWQRLDAYLAVSRINMNVRQVLFDGQTCLTQGEGLEGCQDNRASDAS